VSVIINILTEDAPLRVRNASEVFLNIQWIKVVGKIIYLTNIETLRWSGHVARMGDKTFKHSVLRKRLKVREGDERRWFCLL
jgi:hypothetical protein